LFYQDAARLFLPWESSLRETRHLFADGWTSAFANAAFVLHSGEQEACTFLSGWIVGVFDF